MKQGKSLMELATEIERQAQHKQDYVVKSQVLRMHSWSEGSSRLTLGDEAHGEYTVNDLAHKQIGQHLGIPATYYSKLRGEFPGLLDENVNTLLGASPDGERRMVRTIDGAARAFLSDRYRRLDNFDLLEAVLPTLMETPGLEIASCDVTEQKIYLKVTTSRIQAEVKPGDVVQAGLLISNSEVGLGAVSIQPYSVRLVCLNGAVHNDLGTRRNHVGRLVTDTGEDAYKLFAEETLIADDKAFYLKVRDVVRGALRETVFRRIVSQMREAAGARPDADPVKAVEVLSKKHALNGDEQKGILRHLIEGADLSLWGMANAFTPHSLDVESYDRATELEAIGGNIIALARSEYRELVAA
ncbi:MAG: DUF932 domain-containing protein [Chloroflexota bacterium]